VPELGLVDLPFLFANRDAARAAMDGALGAALAQAIEDKVDYRIVGWFENGFRHISNRLRPVRSPADLAGMTIRVLPSDIQKRTFELLGARPQRLDLTEALEKIVAGTIDAQENPLANTVTYGAHKYHRFHTLTGHFYISRPIFVCRAQFDAWPNELQDAMRRVAAEAVTHQRALALEEEMEARRAIEAEGCRIEELSEAEHAAFVSAVAPMMAAAEAVYGADLVRKAGR
jgi:TRAP-type C4-dicarboxylate transport system substrate-binding protein